MKKPTIPSKKSAKPTPDANPLPATRAQSDIELFVEAGIAALRKRVVEEEAPEIMNRATIFGMNMQQVAIILTEVRGAFHQKSVTDFPRYEPQQLRDEVRKLLKNPTPKTAPAREG